MDIKEIFKGALSFDVDEDGFIMPLRFTKKQLARYETLPTCPYAKAAAGILAEFFTDAAEISFSYIVYKSWTTMFKDSTPTFDVFENDILRENVELSFSDVGNAHRAFYRCRTEGKKKICVVFPCNAEFSVGDFCIGNASPTPARKRRFLILGDSISQGLMNNTSSNNYPFLLRRFFEADFINQSVGGDLFDASALDETGFDPTDIIVALGTNDMAFTGNLEKTSRNITEYLTRLLELYDGKRVFVITPPWLADAEENPERFRLLLDIGEETRRIADARGFTVVDGQALVPHTQRYFSDEAHPNDLGFAHYALNLIKAIAGV